MTLSIAADYTIFDFGETVSLRQIRPEGVTTVSVSNAINGPLTRSQASGGILAIEGDDRSWSLNATQIGSAGVRVDDTFTDASGNRWRVVSCDLRSGDSRWFVTARKEV